MNRAGSHQLDAMLRMADEFRNPVWSLLVYLLSSDNTNVIQSRRTSPVLNYLLPIVI